MHPEGKYDLIIPKVAEWDVHNESAVSGSRRFKAEELQKVIGNIMPYDHTKPIKDQIDSWKENYLFIVKHRLSKRKYFFNGNNEKAVDIA